MRLLLLFIILTSSNLQSQVFNREIKFLASEKNKLDKNFTNSIYKEDNPCMSYFERIEIIHDVFEVKISEKELVLIDEHNLECDIPSELKFEYNLSQLEKKKLCFS